MDISLFLMLMILFVGSALGIGAYFFKKTVSIQKQLFKEATELHHERLAKALVENMIKLVPGNRYLISFPFELTEEELSDVKATLDLENSETHVILVDGTVRVVEFS
ncbi:MAG TPA: hypothetical protein ENI23_02900 [bacterium]|nr:hypothetical protein [bacterium]